MDKNKDTKNTEQHHLLHDIKVAIHDAKESIKETLQGDHPHGQDCEKKPQDGKTNPLE